MSLLSYPDKHRVPHEERRGWVRKPETPEKIHDEERKLMKEELKPLPLGDKCNTLCPFFRCSKNALVVVNKVVKGHVQKVAMCRWIGDTCLGYRCQFAYCERKALLPDGKCAFAVKFREGEKEFIKELDEAKIDEKLKNLLARRSGRKDLFLE
ncbi:MAG: hypothetical protein QXV93_02755 [Zestosphaera sp.]